MWALVLGKHSGQEEVMMGLLYANRDHAGLEEVVGYFVHMLPVRLAVAGDSDFQSILKSTDSKVTEAMQHAVVPFVTLVETFDSARDRSRSPIYQSHFSWLHAGGWALDRGVGDSMAMLQSVPVSQEADDEIEAKVETQIWLEDAAKSEAMHGYIEYNSDLFDRESVQRIAVHSSPPQLTHQNPIPLFLITVLITVLLTSGGEGVCGE